MTSRNTSAWSRAWRHLTVIVSFGLLGATASAQCLSAPNGQWPGSTYVPTCNGSTQTITTCGYCGEYSVVTCTAGNKYTFTSGVSTDYITISDLSGVTVYAAGLGPVDFFPATTGDYRFFTHVSSACGSNTTCRNRNVSCTASTACLTAVNGQWPSATFTPTCNGSFQTITTCGYGSEYSLVNLTAGQPYTFQSSVGTDIITISNSGGTQAYAAGVGPLNYTPYVSGVYRFYLHLTACGAESVCRNRDIKCVPSCAAPTSVAAGSVTSSSASISWSGAGSSFIVEYGAPGFTPGTGASAGVGGTVATAASSPAVISGLSSGTTYSVYVRQVCVGPSYSANSSAASFTTLCSGASCTYTMVLTDNYGDGWNGGAFQVKQNGTVMGTYGTANLSSGCGPVTVPLSVCHGSTLDFVWTANDSYNEPGLRVYDPFGVLVYSFRGSSTYDANCPSSAFSSPNTLTYNSSTFNYQMVPVGSTFFTTTSNCTPPTCTQPTGVLAGNVTGTSADISWTCSGCTGPYIVEYGPAGYTAGTGATAGVGGTLWTGAPVASSPVTITGLSGTTPYSVYVRQQCSVSNYSNSSSVNFTTGVDCATAPTLACTTPTSISMSGTGQWVPYNSCFCGYTTPGQERLWVFNAPTAGTYTLNVTAASSTTYIDYWIKPSSGTCDQTGWTFIRDMYFTGTQDFTIAAPGTYYILADPESTTSVSQTFSIVCPLPCATPNTLSTSNVSSLAAVGNWTCTGCDGNEFFLEVGAPGFIPGTGPTAGGGTVFGPFATSPGSVSGLTPNTSYDLYVRQGCTNVGNGYSNNRGPLFFTTLPPPPPNDSCTQAIPITCGVTLNGTNVGATVDGNPSQCSGGNATVQNGVWYSYVGDDQQVTMSTCGGPFFDTRIHVFKGSCGALIGVGGNDDAGAGCVTSGTQSIVTFNAFAGNTYYIVVEGYSGTGSFSLTATCGPLCNPYVLNDACVDAQTVVMGTNCVQVGGNLSCATSSAGNNPACIGGFNTYPDAYYNFVATAPNAFVTVTGGTGMYLVVYNGTSCITTAGTEFYCGPVTSGAPVLLTGLTTSNTYTIRIMELLANASTFSLCVQKLDVTDDPCAAVPLSCGDLRFGRTTGYLNNIPSGACPFNGAASTSGVNYFSYTAPVDADVTFSTCGQTAFDTRVSVFDGACSALTCNVMDDDAAGCPGGGSEVTVRAHAGQTYTVMVTGSGASNGNYQLSVFCEPWCSGSEANDRCAASTTIPTYITGTGTPSTETQACSYADAPTSCSGASMVQGVWYDFNTGPNAVFDVYVGVNGTNPIYSAPAMSMTLFSGACNGVGAGSEVLCQSNCNGTLGLPTLTPNTTYRMLVYNTGGTNEGTFGLMVSHPGYNDAGISSILQPVDVVCDQKLFPQVYLHNYGEAPLTSAQIISRVDGGIVQTYSWSGGPIARGDSALVTLPVITSPFGLHAYTAEVGTVNGGTDELATNNSSSSSYDASGQTIKVEVRTDGFPGQTSWVVYDAFFFPVASSPLGMSANSVVTTTACLPTTFGSCFYFYMFDAAGDGLAGGSSWQLRDVLDRPVLQDNGSFGLQSPPTSPATSSYFAHEFCLPLGPSAPLSGECNVFNNLVENKVFCNTVAGAVNYQFEFSDPNAGFRRRIAVPRNWVKFSEMQTNPLVFGTTYFCRVRVDQGSTGFFDDFFGAGCEMALSPTQPICTELVSTAGPTLSCGVTKSFGGSDKIYAQPVASATQYRFNFSNTGLGYSRTILKPSYICLLSWVTSPLVSGNTYQVKVEAYVSGVWSGFCGAICPVTISNTPAQGDQSHSMQAMDQTSNEVTLWPNPVRDGQFNLRIGGLTEEQQKVAVDIYDIFGKRVMAASYDNSGDSFKRTIDLPQGIAAGVYTVNITLNGQVSTKRLTVQ